VRCKIHYIALDDFWRKEQKLQWLTENPLQRIPFEIIRPDKNNNWINLVDNDFERLLPLCSKDSKSGKNKEVLFELFSTGISTNRDEWIIDFSKENLKNKMNYFADYYNALIGKTDVDFTKGIKWSRNLKQRFSRNLKENFDEKKIKRVNYRPYIPISIYHSKVFIDEHGLTDSFFYDENKAICISGNGASKQFQTLAIDTFSSLDLLEKTQCLPLYRYDKQGNRIDNITDWGFLQFKEHYTKGMRASNRYTEEQLNAMSDDELMDVGLDEGEFYLTKEYIFHYVYAVLHNPAYRKKYELNLKREFPRIPFYDHFHQWAAWGEHLMDLHINYENAEPYPLRVVMATDAKLLPKPKLKADKEAGIIFLDENTELTGIPAEAWNYKLGNRSALEWILDQYKESKPKDPTIASTFNTYRFADYKEQVIDLLKRVCTVSVETMKIVEEMEKV
jgi:predicted helicase